MQRSLRDERGFSMIVVGLGLVGFTAATLLAIDVGMFMTARAQAQNSADAGALAGATALAYNSFTDRSATGPAVTNAIAAATANPVMSTAVTVTPDDVTFPLDSGGNANLVQVQVHRSGDNAVPTLMGVFFGVNKADVDAVATAQAAPANAMTCVKPFMIPDKWREVQTPPWDPNDTFDAYDRHNNPLPDPDVFINGVTSYSYQQDVGTTLVLRAGRGDSINPSFYYSWKMPDATGGDYYRETIEDCNQSIIRAGTYMTQEPGTMEGPTVQGILTLIAKDPGTYWDADCKCVKGSTYRGQSPRVFPIPLYDPKYYADGKANGRPADFKITQFLGFYADYVQGNGIHGIITNITGLIDPNASSVPDGAFARAIRLVK